MENYQNLINEALGGGTPKECYNNLMDILQERLNNKPAVNHHEELVELIKKFHCESMLSHVGMELAEEFLSKLPTK